MVFLCQEGHCLWPRLVDPGNCLSEEEWLDYALVIICQDIILGLVWQKKHIGVSLELSTLGEQVCPYMSVPTTESKTAALYFQLASICSATCMWQGTHSTRRLDYCEMSRVRHTFVHSAVRLSPPSR